MAENVNNGRMGHNKPPSDFEELKGRIAEQIEVADKWITKRPEVTDDEMAKSLDGFIDQCRQLAKTAETMRKAEKEPHLEAGRQIDRRYKPLVDNLKAAAERLKGPLGRWLEKKQREADEARRKAQAEQAERERTAREAEKRAQESNTLADKMKADEAAAQAETAAKKTESVPERAAVKHDLGTRATSLRTYTEITVTDMAKVPSSILRKVPAEVVVKVVREGLRDGSIDIKNPPPGVEIRQVRKAA